MPKTELRIIVDRLAGAIAGAVATLLLVAALSGETASAADAVVVGQIHRIHSAVLDEDRSYRVSLPESYRWAKDRRYPVLYVLDGQDNFLHTASAVSFLSAQGEIPELIVVAVDSTVRIRDFTQTDWPSHWNGGGGAENFRRFLSTELLPEIERAYRTDGFRILSGHSASAQFVLYCLTTEPALFRAYIALSPSLDWDGNLPQRSLEKAFRATPRLQAFLYVARSDDTGRPLADFHRLVKTLRTTSPIGFRWESRAFPNETHSGVPLLGQIDAMRSVYSGYRFHEDLLRRGPEFARRHYEAVSRKIGWVLPVPEEVMNSLGYEALSAKRIPEAIALFERNAEANPNSANAFDSLADGYAEAQRWKDAAAASEKAAALAKEFELPSRAAIERRAEKMKAMAQQPPGSE